MFGNKTMPEIYDVDEQNEGVETQNDDKNGDSKTTTTMTQQDYQKLLTFMPT